MKTFIRTITVVFFLVVSCSVFSQSKAKTLVLRPGPADGMDADIRTDFPQTPRGSSPDFIANAWTAQGNYFVQRSLLKFDLTGIPVEAEVTQATLYLYTNLTTGHYQLDSGANAAYLYRVAEPWSEDQVFWDNQPSVSLQDPVLLPQSVTHTQNYEINVTAHIQDMVNNPSGNHGWRFQLQTEEKYRCMVFASSDNLNEEWRPKLVVQYTDCIDPVANFSYFINTGDVKFNDLSNHANSWLWSFGDGAASLEQNPSHHYSNPGIYHVCLEIADSCGTSSFCDTLVVECSPPETAFAYDYINTTVNFYDTSVSVHPYAWFWDFGDSTTASLQNPVHVYNQLGTYEVCLTVTDSCGQDFQCKSVCIVPPMKPSFTALQNETNNLKVSFHDESEGATSWLWNFGDGNTSQEQSPVHIFAQYGEYDICLTVGNSLSHETACDLLKVQKTNVQANGNSIIIYPNPFTGNGNLSFMLFEDAGFAEITITDFSGRMVLQEEFRNVQKNVPVAVNIERLGKGSYLFEGTFNNYRKKIKFEIF